MLNVFCSPSRYVQGVDATLELGQELLFLNISGPILIVSTRHSVSILEEKWKQAFKQSNHPYFIYLFQGECSEYEISQIVQEGREKGVVAIIGAGGGKVMDAAKAAAHDLNIHVIICPTIASSDAPCSALSVIYTNEGVVSNIRFYPKNPCLVLVDSDTIAKAAPRFLSAGMGDALSTYFEAKTCVEGKKINLRGGGPTHTSFFLAKLCYETLLEDGAMALAAVKAQSVTPSLERIIEANTLLSGLGFESCGLAAAHSIHNGLTTISQTHSYLHGEKVAFGTLTQLVLEGKQSSLIEEVLGFLQSVNLPMTLKQIGIENPNNEILDSISNRALQKGESIHNEPFEISKKVLIDAIQTADEIGRTYLNKPAKNC
jgi:glycerol dehydrogenase